MNNQFNFLKIGKGNYLNKEKILLISNELNSRPVIEFREKVKGENKLIKLTSGKEAKSFVLLENGYLVTLQKKAEEIIEILNRE